MDTSEYIQTPWVPLKAEALTSDMKHARDTVMHHAEARVMYRYLQEEESGLAQRMVNHAMQGAEVGKQGFYATIAHNVESTPDALTAGLQGRADVITSAPSYLTNFGGRYEPEFAKAKVDPFDTRGLTIMGSLWRDTALSNLHQAFDVLAKDDPALMATMLYTRSGQKALEDYGFSTHPEAYLASGFMDTTITDWMTSAIISYEDLGSERSVRQLRELGSKGKGEGVKSLSRFVDTYASSAKTMAKHTGKFMDKHVRRWAEESGTSPQETADYLHSFFTKKGCDATAPEGIASMDDAIAYGQQLAHDHTKDLEMGGKDGYLGAIKRTAQMIKRTRDMVKKAPGELKDLLKDMIDGNIASEPKSKPAEQWTERATNSSTPRTR